eukprot:CAMPEP_0119543680 /NCGR_PEP_ID=MMETSP1344-20130328/54272_1 /TAXON_ID=236787 /ORGANISM="Florenciella parvula, Strain CCMP2471" /LENGTH=36 /DNA_ID= /DNA_START= /DNA_END= /DNA_ORIENTATION=
MPTTLQDKGDTNKAEPLEIDEAALGPGHSDMEMDTE